MRLPGVPSLTYLGYLLLFLPWMALRSAQRVRAARTGQGVLPSRPMIWIGTMVSLAILLVLATLTGRGFGFDPFERPALGLRAVLAGLAALAAMLVLREIARATRPESERRTLLVYRLAPRSAGEWALSATTIAMASVTEEIAYRGVGMSILWYATGNPWLAAAVCAIAFGLAHGTQGWRSAVVITAIALVFHGLVAVTGTLIVAMVVHAVYDAIASIQIARRARVMDREAAAAQRTAEAAP